LQTQARVFFCAISVFTGVFFAETFRIKGIKYSSLSSSEIETWVHPKPLINPTNLDTKSVYVENKIEIVLVGFSFSSMMTPLIAKLSNIIYKNETHLRIFCLRKWVLV
jgi:hypothetical protein